jgi:hypothetical protein
MAQKARLAQRVVLGSAKQLARQLAKPKGLQAQTDSSSLTDLALARLPQD